MIIIHAKMTIDSAKETKFLEEMTSLLELSRAEEGNISYDLTKQTDRENDYIMVETWQDLNAVAAHNTSAHFTAFSEKAKEYLTAPIQINLYEANKIK
ncbi:putative quinol monooxygenase [Bacillus sp. AFS053548]|uniref:putative quinol monooxygenase n=1 Tax=Bacillus sp. AFS053548 TaxID=2033505 RepID=UPI000BFC087B|nr:putative quinol monooxygenase [Bacillus sp. AFS053548]PGM57403.1 antibiotic biosynthesis monooxygenase [Bacillus sp. AFS053548]